MAMRKRDKKLFESPEEMESSELGNVTFASHMSYLTNKRLHDIFIMCDMNGIAAQTTLQLEHLNSYKSVLWTVYTNLESVLGEDERDKIDFLFGQYDLRRFKKKLPPKERYLMYTMLSNVNRLINYGMQKHQYFFRMETHPIKGMRKTMIKLGWVEDDGKVGKSVKLSKLVK